MLVSTLGLAGAFVAEPIQASCVSTKHLSLESATWEWEGVPRVVAIGDIHGSDDKLIRLLTGSGLVDRNLHWTGGGDHLVVVGDFIDRGSGDLFVMDLLQRLQVESIAAGGKVHVLLGNHEVMNLFRDTRYVNTKTFGSFADIEQKTERKRAWASYAAKFMGRPPGESLRNFNLQFPPGFFARQTSFEAHGKYGKWLVDLPTIVKINDVVFVHGGLSVEFAELGVAGINRTVGSTIRCHLESRRVLESTGFVTPVMRLAEIRAAAERAISRQSRRVSIEVRDAAESLLDATNNPILKARGPLWYRGNSFEDERIERDTIEQSLKLIDGKALVVAHSPTRGGKITSRFHGQLFRVDHGIGSSERPLALVVERGEMMVLDASNGAETAPVRELPSGENYGPFTHSESDDDLKSFLLKATIVEARDLGRGSTRPQLVTLERSGLAKRAVFKTVDSSTKTFPKGPVDRYQHEVAAFRLDRLLGLEMVPVTVIRNIEGRRGSLQAWIESAVDLGAAWDYSLVLFETEASKRQLRIGKVFDALIGNLQRSPGDVLLSLNTKEILLIDHSSAFSDSFDLAWRLVESVPADSALEKALRSLEHDLLVRELGDLLADRQIEALQIRRDKILAQFSSARKR